jgi:hypothetical protein
MKNRNNLHTTYILAIIALLAIIILPEGCRGTVSNNVTTSDNITSIGNEPGYTISYDQSGEKIITIKKGIGYYSMEFPEGFDLDLLKIDQSLGVGNLLVYFVGPQTPDVGFPLISINVVDWGNTITAESTEKSLLASARRLENFKLLDESTLQLAGVVGYQYSYYSDRSPWGIHAIPPEGKESLRVTRLERAVYFNHSGYLWTISLASDPTRDVSDNAVFNKVLGSFKVLN